MSRPTPEQRSEDDEIKALLRTPVTWTRTADLLRPFRATVDGQAWVVRIGEFPEEPLYTLIVDDAVVGSFSNWPAVWQRPRVE